MRRPDGYRQPIPTPNPVARRAAAAGPAGSSGTTATVVSLAGNPVPAAAAPAAKPAAKAAALKLTSARLVFKDGKRYLVVRVNGAAKTAKVRITLVMRTGKATKPVVRTIRDEQGCPCRQPAGQQARPDGAGGAREVASAVRTSD